MLISVVVTLLLLFISFLTNRFSARENERYSIHANTVGLSIYFFIFWIILCLFFPSIKLKWTLSVNELVFALVLALMMVFTHVFLYHWQTKSSDYQEFKEKGLIQDGCPYSGRFSILKNFITHGGEVLWEEILFRGIITLLLYPLLGLAISIILPSIIFGLVHFIPFLNYAKKHNIVPGVYVYGAFIEPCIFPMIFAYSNFSMGSLIPGWVMHWGLNCSVGLYLRYLEPRIIRIGHGV